MRFAFIDAEKAHFPVAVLCRNLWVTRQGYYAFAKRWKQQTPISSRLDELLARAHGPRLDQNPMYGERVRFVFTVLAGRGPVPKDRLPRAVQHWLPFKNDPWYIALAAGDLDGDGELQYLAAASEYRGVAVLNDGLRVGGSRSAPQLARRANA